MKKKIVVIYHKNCPDGFGSAWAAWKKFGNKAEYIPTDPHILPQKKLKGKELYVLDNSFSEKDQKSLRKENDKVVVIDHHKSAEHAVRAFSENIFDLKHSGAVLSWKYFHPKKKIPMLLKYIEDNDLWKFKIPFSRDVAMFINVFPFDFKIWNGIAQKLEHSILRKQSTEKGKIVGMYAEIVSREIVEKASLVQLGKYKVLAANNSSKKFTSYIGHLLCRKHPPMGIVWYVNGDMLHVSFRSEGSFDVAKIAEKYGGGGHKNAAAFIRSLSKGFPWKFLK